MNRDTKIFSKREIDHLLSFFTISAFLIGVGIGCLIWGFQS